VPEHPKLYRRRHLPPLVAATGSGNQVKPVMHAAAALLYIGVVVKGQIILYVNLVLMTIKLEN
jgi:hypothetical protein